MFNHSHSKLSLAQPSFYIPLPNHSLYDVVVKSYGIQPGQEPVFSVLLDYLQALNPEIKNPRLALGNKAPRTLDFISHDPNTLLCMNPEVVKARIRQAIAMGGEFSKVDVARGFVPADPQARGMYEFLARLSNDTQHVTDFAGVGLGVIGYLSGANNQAVMWQLQQLHVERSSGRISLRQYQLKQQQLLNTYLNKLGWMGRHIHGGQKAFNSLYQNRAVGINPSPVFAQHAERMARLSGLTKGGGILLTGFGVAGPCAKIASTSNIDMKNEILLVEGFGIAGGALGGSLAGVAVGLVVASGPVGWAVALVASAVGGYYFQEKGKHLGGVIYNQYGKQLDIYSASGIGSICR